MWRRVRRLFGSSVRADVQDELRFHMEAMIQDLVSQGWQPDAARREAKRKFGSIEEVQRMGEQMAEERETGRQRSDYLEAWAQDVRYAFRTLRKDRVFATVAICILALGIAANTAVFSVVNTVLLRPLPFPNADQLTWLASGRGFSKAMREAIGLSGVTYTVDVYEEYQRHNDSFQSLTSYNPFFGNSEYTLTGRGEAQPVVGVMVAENFFETLGVQPEAGRFFLKEECQKGGPPAVLLSYPFWQRQFAGDPRIIGQAVTLSKTPVTVVGVLPQSFDFGAEEVTLEAGDMCIVSTAKRFRSRSRDGVAFRTLIVPAAFLVPLIAGGGPQMPLHIRVASPFGALLGASLDNIWDRILNISEELGDAVLANLAGLLAVACGTSKDGTTIARQGAAQMRRDLVLRHIECHLAEPDLTPDHAARALGMSTRQVHAMLEPTGETFARHVTRRRLEACESPSGARPVRRLRIARRAWPTTAWRQRLR